MPIMKKPLYLIVLVSIAAVSFVAGRWFTRGVREASNPGGRRILYYHDPMHPAYKSDKPGIAPDCGMQLEPVYADDPNAGKKEPGKPMRAGTVQISSEMQQKTGITTEAVRRGPGLPAFRTLGRVAADESQIFQVAPPVEGWLRKVAPIATGSMVHKNDLLGSFISRDLQRAQQIFLASTNAQAQLRGSNDKLQVDQERSQARWAEENLIISGISEAQIQELARSGRTSSEIELRAPASGLVLARRAFPNSQFERGTELFRIANIDHVWVFADIFENEARLLRALKDPMVRYRGQVFPVRKTDSPLQFDAASRTLKIRLELENTGLILRPDMFVEVYFKVDLPTALTVPVDAVVDSGMKKTVFVDVGNGVFEPRRVETGWRMDSRVEITAGLKEGERIVVSGNFLLDSESRLQLAAAGLPENHAVDPVCGMGVDPRKAELKKSSYEGLTYYFCSELCKGKFDKNPEQYRGQGSGVGGQESTVGSQAEMAKDPACGMDVDITSPGVIEAEYKGTTYYFCTPSCRNDFMKDPGRYLRREQGTELNRQASGQGARVQG